MAVKTAADYLEQLRALLPPGPAWDREQAPEIDVLLRGLAAELARVDRRIGTLLDENDPRTTFEMLTDWERVAGLPGPCATLEETIQERRGALVAQLTSIGGQSAAYFIGLARRLGYEVTLSEYRPFRAGWSCAGDELTNGTWIHRWMIRAPETTTFDFKAGQSVAGEPLRRWGEALLECTIRQRKPAHTEVSFAYGK